MAYTIEFTPTAVNSLEQILNFIEKTWTKKSIDELKKNINKTIKMLKKFPKASPIYHIDNTVRMSVVKNYILLLYIIDEINKKVIISAFIDARQQYKQLK
ncbi:MAG: type II toxin-antitoxin system RelE/ParE family toxin [Chitinophagales bacterium]|nr:type II toxin-antitoxin system RelE/ParE family toxin [Chitinophagales bacterium]